VRIVHPDAGLEAVKARSRRGHHVRGKHIVPRVLKRFARFLAARRKEIILKNSLLVVEALMIAGTPPWLA
jgi:hypothetical protein